LLFGAVSLPAGTMNGIVLATRATVRDPFSAPEPIVTSESSGEWLSPTISEDCRSLYVVHLPSSAPRGVEVFER